MNKKFLPYVDWRLNQWAEWFTCVNLHGIGFPSSSIEYRLMTEGVIINSTAPKQTPCHEDAEEIESLVKEIERENKKMGLALRSQYFGNVKSRERAKRLGMCHSQFRNYVDLGRQWLVGRLSAYHR
jgi:hypothetical protein